MILQNSETSLDLIMRVRFGLGTQVGCQSRPTGLGRDKKGHNWTLLDMNV